MLAEHFPQVDHPNWAACERLVPHIQVCAARLEQQNTAQSEAAALFGQAGWYLRDRPRYEQAAPLYQRALAIYEQQLGPDHPNTASSLNNLAGLYWAQGKYSEAEPLYQWTLALALGGNFDYLNSSKGEKGRACFCQSAHRIATGRFFS